METPLLKSEEPVPLKCFDDVVDLELSLSTAAEKIHGAQGRWLRHPPRDLFGLALSGGGIRSATFNLGVLQGLADLGVLSCFDYLSTVSGGGYIGAFWSTWRTRSKAASKIHFPVPAELHECSGPECPEIRHLREFSNFLSPKLGLFTLDTGNAVVTVVASLIPSLVATLSLIMLVLFAWAAVGWGLFTQPADFSTAVLVGALLLIQAVFETVWQRSSKVENRSLVTYLLCCVLALTAAGLLWRWLLLNRFFFGSLQARLLVPAGAAGGAALLLIALRWLFSRWIGPFVSRSRRAALDRVLSRLLFAVAAWLVLSGLWLAGCWLSDHSVATLLAAGASGGAFTWVRKLLGSEPSKPRVGGLVEWLKPIVPQVLAYVTVALMVILCVILVLQCSEHGIWLLWEHLTPFWVAMAITLLTLFCLNPNEVGIHAFYRGRLARTYLGASNAAAQKIDCNRVTADCERDDLPLNELCGEKPFHLICCAANDLAGDQLENLFRGAKSATLSRLGFSVGDRWAAWRGKRAVPTVGDAITASGAAFNSHMGWHSMEWGPAVTFLMTAFNLRLGFWLPHPAQWYQERSRRSWLLGWPFFKELFSSSRAQGPDVHLSDGGHFEDMALYELVRRHCRYILVCDCGADPDVAFDDLGNAVRRVREDFGAEISIDLSPLRPGADGLARQPMVAGDIHYPDGDTGVLLVLKPTLVGNEPVDILQYKRRNSAFPHETTGDQFYDAAQWESYRRLGRHAVKSAFLIPVRMAASLNPADDLCCAQVFAKARSEWLPVPVAAHENFPRLAKRCSEIEDLLRDAQCKALLHEVYKEIDELDREAVSGSSPAPAQAQDGAAGSGWLSGEELTSSLQVLRVAILFMEEVFFALDLDTQYTHPVNLGWINYFARWAYSPLFRMWWPLLKPMYAARFTRFFEDQFGLARLEDPPSAVEDVTGTVGQSEKGFAWACWLAEQKPAYVIPQDVRVLSYKLAMKFRRQKVYQVQAGLLLVRIISETALWPANDLYVPPGLWGAGIGEAFLQDAEGTLRGLGVKHLVVQLRTQPNDMVARKKSADAAQLYRCAHFLEARLSEGKLIAGTLQVDPGTDLKTIFSDGAESSFTWMIKEI